MSHLSFILSPRWEHDFAVGQLPAMNTLNILAGVNYSLMPDVKNSVFVEGLIGISVASGVDGDTFPDFTSSTAFTWEVGVGKRFALTDWVTYRPEITYTWKGNQLDTENVGELAIMPAAFSFFF